MNDQVPADFENRKLPPQACEFEEAVLGAILIEKEAISETLDLLTQNSFYREQHQIIYKSLLKLFDAGQPIDILTATEQLRQDAALDRIGGPAYITSLTARVASSAHIVYHAQIIQQKYLQRQIINVASRVLTRAYDASTDVKDLLDYNENELFKVTQGMIKKDTLQIGGYLKETIQKILDTSKSKSPFSGIPSGYEKLDKITSGWQPSDLIIIAARPSMGKTAFVISMAANMAIQQNKSVAIFSLEMSCSQLVDRLISGYAEIPLESLRNGKQFDKQLGKLYDCIHALETAPIYIDDTPALSVFELRAKCRRLKRKNNIDLVVVDYLQLMTAGGDPRSNREQEVSQISRSLKSLAKELEVPVIALSQLNRSVESRAGSKRPQLSDLRESGAIEQDADVVAFIHRPEKYGILQDENGNSLSGIAEIIMAKHRNGPLGDITLKFIDKYVKFIAPDLELNPGQSMRYYSSKMNTLTN